LRRRDWRTSSRPRLDRLCCNLKVHGVLLRAAVASSPVQLLFGEERRHQRQAVLGLAVTARVNAGAEVEVHRHTPRVVGPRRAGSAVRAFDGATAQTTGGLQRVVGIEQLRVGGTSSFDSVQSAFHGLHERAHTRDTHIRRHSERDFVVIDDGVGGSALTVETRGSERAARSADFGQERRGAGARHTGERTVSGG